MSDDRVKCADCRQYVGGWCRDAVKAGLSPKTQRAEVGQALAELPQRCQAHQPRGAK